MMENRSNDSLAWYCGALGPDRTVLSRGDFEALQNRAGISWTDVSKASAKVTGARGYFFDTLPSKTHEFMSFSPGSMYTDSLRGVLIRSEFEYRITLFALKLDLEDWAGDWGNDLLSLLPSIKKLELISDFVTTDSGVPSKFREKLGDHVIGSKELTFRASY